MPDRFRRIHRPGRPAVAPILSVAHDIRRRRTNVEISDMRLTMYEILLADHPQSVRHVFYRMTDPRLSCAVEKSERGYRHVQYQLAEMRRRGDLPYGWIVDATRTGYFVATFDDAFDFIKRVSGVYRTDVWKNSGVYLEVWVESRSIAGVIKPICEEYGVPLYPSGGFATLTLSFEAASYIGRQVAGSDKTIEILYIGDYDPAGVLIDRDIEEKLRGHLTCDNPLTFNRIGSTRTRSTN
jgi:hypothetical protein